MPGEFDAAQNYFNMQSMSHGGGGAPYKGGLIPQLFAMVGVNIQDTQGLKGTEGIQGKMVTTGIAGIFNGGTPKPPGFFAKIILDARQGLADAGKAGNPFQASNVGPMDGSFVSNVTASRGGGGDDGMGM